MAVFTDLVNMVYELTSREDLVTQTAQAVKAATLKAHQSDFYPKDIFETGVIFDSAQYLQSLDYRSLLPSFRALKYIRKTDVNAVATDIFIEVISPERAVDSWTVNKEDVCYLAGASLQIRSSTLLQYIFLGCYLNPNITEDGYNSWIALDHPFAIVYEAARTIFKTIGFDEQSAQYERLVMEQFQELKMELTPVGY